MLDGRGIAERVGGVCDEEIIDVIPHVGGVAEGIAGAVWKKEVLLGKGELLGWRIGRMR